MLGVVVEHIPVGLLSRVVDTGSCSGISVESCTRSQDQGIPGQPGAITMIRQ